MPQRNGSLKGTDHIHLLTLGPPNTRVCVHMWKKYYIIGEKELRNRLWSEKYYIIGHGVKKYYVIGYGVKKYYVIGYGVKKVLHNRLWVKKVLHNGVKSWYITLYTVKGGLIIHS